MRFRQAGAVAIALLLVFGGFLATATDAKDAAGCDGLAAYRVATFKAAREYLTQLDKDGLPQSRDYQTYSSDDWTTYAADALGYQRALKKIQAPEWATAYHQDLIAQAGLAEQLGKAAATSGLLAAAMTLTQAGTDLGTKVRQDIAAIADHCPDFTAFARDHNALDGDIDGTPVATPTD